MKAAEMNDEQFSLELAEETGTRQTFNYLIIYWKWYTIGP